MAKTERYVRVNELIAIIRRHADEVKCDDSEINSIYKMAHEHIIDLINHVPMGELEVITDGDATIIRMWKGD